MPTALAFRYARALAEVAIKASVNPEDITAELNRVTEALDANQDLEIALESPAVPRPRKRAIVARLAGILASSDLVRRFLMVLVDHRRTPLLHDIREAFETVIDERLGIARAEVASARPLSDAQRHEVIARLEQVTGRQTRARFAIQPELIGGVVARIGSTVYDGSIRGQLEALKQRLAGAET